MNVIRARNVHQIFPGAIALISQHGIGSDSRNGKVLQMGDPVASVYDNPLERVIFWEQRDANPFFHFFEGLWMLAGRDDVEPLEKIVKRMKGFSDDGETLWGAYGHRWRKRFGRDQLAEIVGNLRNNPKCRRQVLQMWSAELDLSRTGKDVPCNVTATFQIGVDGKLQLCVFCRSNDVIWGCYGANAVQFSFLLEYVATLVGVPAGRYTQVSVNWHAYLDSLEPIVEKMSGANENYCPYEAGTVRPFPLMTTSSDAWHRDLAKFMRTAFSGAEPQFQDQFFAEVAWPIMQAHRMFKSFEGEDRFLSAKEALRHCLASDWAKACVEWIDRRHKKWVRDYDDGPTVPEGRPQ